MADNNFSLALATSLSDVKEALPVGFNTTRFVQNAVALLNGNTVLQDFAHANGTAQIKSGLMQGAYLGLDFMNGDAYLVPFKGKLNFMKSYKGAVKLAKQYSTRPIKNIFAEVVRQGDEFINKVVDGEQTVDFSPIPFNDGDIVGAFAVCQFEDGTKMVETMSLKDIQNTRSHSKASSSGPWVDFFGEMCKKTVLHRICKKIDLDMNAEQRMAYESDEQIETDSKKVAENEVDINANKEVFTADFEMVEDTAQ